MKADADPGAVSVQQSRHPAVFTVLMGQSQGMTGRSPASCWATPARAWANAPPRRSRSPGPGQEGANSRRRAGLLAPEWESWPPRPPSRPGFPEPMRIAHYRVPRGGSRSSAPAPRAREDGKPAERGCRSRRRQSSANAAAARSPTGIARGREHSVRSRCCAMTKTTRHGHTDQALPSPRGGSSRRRRGPDCQQPASGSCPRERLADLHERNRGAEGAWCRRNRTTPGLDTADMPAAGVVTGRDRLGPSDPCGQPGLHRLGWLAG